MTQVNVQEAIIADGEVNDVEECLICNEYFDKEANVEEHLNECIPKFFNREFRVQSYKNRVGELLLTGFDGKYLFGTMNGFESAFDITDTSYDLYFKGTSKEMLKILGES